MSDPSNSSSTPQIPAWQRASSQPKQNVHAQESSGKTTASADEPSSSKADGAEAAAEEDAVADASTDINASETQKKDESSNAHDDDDGSAGIRTALLESARKWLADDSIKDTPTSDKISFLEQKGLDADDVKSLLGLVEDNAAATSNIPSTEKSPSSMGSASASALQSTSSSSSSSPSSMSAPAATASAPPPPPIITYPEFLSTPNHQPPLLTLPALLGTVYGVTGLAASAWAASKYWLNPMINSLAEARLDFNDNAKQNVEEMNRKLEELVSEIPAGAMPVKKITRPGSRSGITDGFDGDNDEDEDPTELFHRDMGVQVDTALLEARAAKKEANAKSPSPFRARSRSSHRGRVGDSSFGATTTTGASEKPFPQSSPDKATHNITQVSNLLSTLRDFAATEREHDESNQQAQRRVQDLQMYLDGMTYCVPSYLNQFGVAMDDGLPGGKEDAVTAFRKEIRSVKGTLLSAKNFPAARRR